MLDKKTKTWVNEQNKINKKERHRPDSLYIESENLRYPDLQLSTASPTENTKGGKITTPEKETPQPSRALQEFVKHIANPLVDKGWNLHLKFGKGESQKVQYVQGSSSQKPMGKAAKKEKVSRPPLGKQIPLEMGTGGGGGGKKGGGGGKRPPEDKIDIENDPSENGEDSSSETSFELEVDPRQLAAAGVDGPLLRLRLTPRRRVAVAAPGGGGTPPLPGGVTEMVPPERPNGRRPDQPIEGGEGPPQPPNGGGGGVGPPLIERDRRMPQQPAGGGGAPPPGGNGGGNGNGNGDENGGGGRLPPPRGNGGGGGDDDGDDDGDDGDGSGGDDSPPPSDQGQPRHR